jgi:tripeptide aminopeptidase
MAALAKVGVRGTLETGSTDGNVPLAEGCPAVTIGITRGGNAHRLDEYVETAPVSAGMRQLITLTLAAAAVGWDASR